MVAEVPFVDVVTPCRTRRFPLTVNEWDEWGDPRDPEFLAYLAGYSPYDNLPLAEGRPPLLVTGALHDPRVLVGSRRSGRWRCGPVIQARAQARIRTIPRRRARCCSGSRPLRAHSGPAGRFGHVDYEAEVAAWILAALL